MELTLTKEGNLFRCFYRQIVVEFDFDIVKGIVYTVLHLAKSRKLRRLIVLKGVLRRLVSALLLNCTVTNILLTNCPRISVHCCFSKQTACMWQTIGSLCGWSLSMHELDNCRLPAVFCVILIAGRISHDTC